MYNHLDPFYRQDLEMVAGGDQDIFNPLVMNRGLDFFCPDPELIQWLGKYIDERLLMEIGCGSGQVLRMLDNSFPQIKTVGFEPMWDQMTEMKSAMERGRKALTILPWTVEDRPGFITDLTKSKETLLLFCRPCHGKFVENAVDAAYPGTEIMYITLEENLEIYKDLGKYQHLLKEIPHTGSSIDNEKVYVFVKP